MAEKTLRGQLIVIEDAKRAEEERVRKLEEEYKELQKQNEKLNERILEQSKAN